MENLTLLLSVLNLQFGDNSMSNLSQVTKVASKSKRCEHRSYSRRRKDPNPGAEGHSEQGPCTDPPPRNSREGAPYAGKASGTLSAPMQLYHGF